MFLLSSVFFDISLSKSLLLLLKEIDVYSSFGSYGVGKTVSLVVLSLMIIVSFGSGVSILGLYVVSSSSLNEV